MRSAFSSHCWTHPWLSARTITTGFYRVKIPSRQSCQTPVSPSVLKGAAPSFIMPLPPGTDGERKDDCPLSYPGEISPALSPRKDFRKSLTRVTSWVGSGLFDTSFWQEKYRFPGSCDRWYQGLDYLKRCHTIPEALPAAGETKGVLPGDHPGPDPRPFFPEAHGTGPGHDILSAIISSIGPGLVPAGTGSLLYPLCNASELN